MDIPKSTEIVSRKKSKKKKTKKKTNKCRFKDVQGFKISEESTILCRLLLTKNGRWGRFPDDHIMNRGGSDVLKSVLQENVGLDDVGYLEAVNNSSVSNELSAMCDETVKRHRKTMVWSSYSAKKLDDPDCKHILEIKDAYKFIKRDLLATFSHQLLGSKANWNTFLLKVKQLMNQGCYGVMKISDLMAGIKQSHIPWLSQLEFNGYRLRTIAKILRWIVTWTVTYISSFWQVVDTQDKIQYFDRRYWQRMVDKTYQSMKQSGKLGVAGTGELPITVHLKFIPKDTGLFRPLTCVKSVDSDFLQATANLKEFLKSVIKKFPWKIAHQGTLRNIVVGLQKYATLKRLNKIGTLYFVKVDIDDAFGSILHDKLQSILRRIFDTLIPSNQIVKECVFGQTDDETGYFRKYVEYQFNNEKDGAPKGFFLRQKKDVNVKTTVEFLSSFMKNTGVKFSKFNHPLVRGIGQGFKISGLCSDIYYRDLVDTCLAEYLNNKNDVFFRFADDMLFVTPDQDRARKFLTRMKAGFPEYNCRINSTKTQTNIDSPEKDIQNSSCVLYLGALINFENLTLTPRFKTHFADRVKWETYDRKNKKWILLKPRMVFWKCAGISGSRIEPWFMDLRVNDKEAVLLNLENGARYLGTKLLNTHLTMSGQLNTRYITLTIHRFTMRIVRSCRKITNRICPSRGRDILDDEIEMAVLKGVFGVYAVRSKYRLVALALRNAIKKRTPKPGAQTKKKILPEAPNMR